MLELTSPRWRELHDAYGSAAQIPGLLRQLSDLPTDAGDAEPWFSLWSALAHQGEVYPASFAAVPHVIAALASAPETASEAYFHFPAWIEICRHKGAVKIPDDLALAYFEAVGRIPSLVAHAEQTVECGVYRMCAVCNRCGKRPARPRGGLARTDFTGTDPGFPGVVLRPLIP